MAIPYDFWGCQSGTVISMLISHGEINGSSLPGVTQPQKLVSIVFQELEKEKWPAMIMTKSPCHVPTHRGKYVLKQHILSAIIEWYGYIYLHLFSTIFILWDINSIFINMTCEKNDLTTFQVHFRIYQLDNVPLLEAQKSRLPCSEISNTNYVTSLLIK